MACTKEGEEEKNCYCNMKRNSKVVSAKLVEELRLMVIKSAQRAFLKCLRFLMDNCEEIGTFLRLEVAEIVEMLNYLWG